MNAILVLEDGHFFRGQVFAGSGEARGEVVFNTSPTGYQEILTDPSYVGQIVVLTTSHVGNYGVNASDIESARTRVAGLITRDYHPVPSNWRSDRTLASYLDEADVTGLTDFDTRALVLHIRQRGSMRGVVRPLLPSCQGLPWAGSQEQATGEAARVVEEWVAQARSLPSMRGLDLAGRVMCEVPWTAGDGAARFHVVALDFGIKLNIVRQLTSLGCRVTVLPGAATASQVMDLGPDGVLLSNGPGDPEAVDYAVQTTRQLLGHVPLFGICLGHQILALACGGSTYKMPFGHRGANHPVRDLQSGHVHITSQNHGFAVEASSLDDNQVLITHVNLNDNTVEGLWHRRLPAFSVQFHPEASPGPHDSHHLFRRFLALMERGR